MSVQWHVHVCSSRGSQERALDALELKSQAVVSHLTWVLGTEFGSSNRAICMLNC